MPGIGVLNEKPLHASLKDWYSQPGDQIEVPVEGFVVDIVRDDQLLEIQTANFAAMKSKLRALLPEHKLRIIYPIATEKWIVKSPRKKSERVSRRKSPKKGQLADVFSELVSIPQHLSHENFSLDVLLIREEEQRRHQRNRSWRRRGWVVEERRLVEVVERVSFDALSDWCRFIPSEFDTFTARELSDATGISLMLAQRLVYCLKKSGVLTHIGKRGRAYLYQMASDHSPSSSKRAPVARAG